MSENQQEMVPPWEAFPTYERYTIGWRMGAGESYRYDWHDFLETIPKDFESRLAYLKRHRPAPLNWGDSVLYVLYPSSDEESDDDDDEYDKAKEAKLKKLGLIKPDIAYHTWLKYQQSIIWPWSQGTFAKDPLELTRYQTRDFWFFSRQLQELRTSKTLDFGTIPEIWKVVEQQIRTGELGDIHQLDLERGLLALAKMLCAGKILSPWDLGLTVDDYDENFEMDMGYVDAFHLWVMSAFDDDELLYQMFPKENIPKEWLEWMEEYSVFEI